MAFKFNKSPVGNMTPNGPVRRKKRPNILQTIAGAFFGVLLILASPIAMWMAGDQHKADDFESAQSVAVDTAASGYVTFRGAPEFVEPDAAAACKSLDCIYEHVSNERLEKSTKLECSNNIKEDEMTRILYQDGYEYDDETGETVPCYQVERARWEQVSESEILNDVAVGAFTIAPHGSAVYLDTVEEIEETEFTEDETGQEEAVARTVYTTFPLPEQLTVAGQATNGRVVKPSDKTYVLSRYDGPQTLQMLDEMDKQNRLVLWVVTFFMMFIGYSLIFGPIHSLARIFLHVPLMGPIGRAVAQGSRSMIGVLSLLLAAITWVIVWFFVTIIQVWWLGLIVVLLLIGLGYWRYKKNQS